MVLLAAPVLARRRAPLAALVAAVVLGVGLNGLLFGTAIRCGATIPTLAYLGFWAGRAAAGRSGLAIVAAWLGAGVALQAIWDPVMASGGALVAVVFDAAILAGARLARARDLDVEALRRRSQELELARERTACAAVDAERVRVGTDIGATVQARLGDVLAATAAAERAVDVDPGAARAALRDVEATARGGLEEMRGVLGLLHRDAGGAATAPLPTLAELEPLLAAHRARCVLRVEGDRRALSPGLELAACRIAEQLADVVDPARMGLEVVVDYEPGRLVLGVAGDGPAAPDRALVAAVRERAALHGGGVEVARGREGRATAWLPLAVGRA
jgi:signal transduction histidine kinase